MNISFLTTGHDPFDDRIFHHLARSFSDKGWNVEIVSSKVNLHESREGIILNCFAGDELPKREKISRFAEKLSDFSPDIIFCSEPFAVLVAKEYSRYMQRKVRIVYDITEWYPSKKNLENFNFFSRWFVFLKLVVFNILVSAMTDAFIFGERYKSRPYRILFPRKPFVFIPYYPDKKYISYIQPDIVSNRLRLSFSGRISYEKGFKNFVDVIKQVSETNKDLKIEVKIIGWYQTLKDNAECEKLIKPSNHNISFSFYEKQPLPDFINLIRDSDIFLDLRKDDFENIRCLPIKIFYYAALGRPVIFTDLKAIRKEVEIGKFGYLVNPGDKIKIAEIISMYLKDSETYLKHSAEAHHLFEIKYNWTVIEPQLLKFVNEIAAC